MEQAWQALGEVRVEQEGQCERCWLAEEMCEQDGGGQCRMVDVVRRAGAAILGLKAEEVGDWVDGEAAKAGLAVREEESEWRVWRVWLGLGMMVNGRVMTGVCKLVGSVEVVVEGG